MPKKEIALDKLASELFADISRAHMSLSVRGNVLEPLAKNQLFQTNHHGVFNHLVVSTVTLSFMTISRLFDESNGRFSVTLDDLIGRVSRERAGQENIAHEAQAFRKSVNQTRKNLALLRNNVFAHKNYYEHLPKVRWAELEDALALSKRVLEWYGREFGHGYIYRVPGFDQDCRRFVEAQPSA